MTAVFKLVQSLTGNPQLDEIMLFMAEWLVLLVPLVMVYLWFVDERGKVDSLISFATAVAGIAISYGLSALYFHQNPSATFETLAAPKPENAFPSQHTAVILSAALPLIWKDRKKLGISLFVAGILTGFARVYIGEHWPLDILGSLAAAIIAFALMFVSSDLYEVYLEKLAEKSQKIENSVFEKLKS